MKLANQGLIARTGPDGKQYIDKLSPDENVVLQGKLAQREALAKSDQDLQNFLNQRQI